MEGVLVIDDDGDVLDLVELWLRTDGQVVTTARSAAAALETIDRDGMPSAVVLDVDMPGMNGLDLLQQLRRRSPELPVLLLTALWAGPQAESLHSVGVPVLPKPCTATSLRTAVRELLRRCPASRQVAENQP